MEQKLRFLFPDGTDLAFTMKLSGTQLQMPLGLASNVPALFHAVKNNPNVRIEISGIEDSIELDLSAQNAVLEAMEACRE